MMSCMDVTKPIAPPATPEQRRDLLFVVPAAETVPAPIMVEDQREQNQPLLIGLSKHLDQVAALIDQSIAADFRGMVG